MPDFIWQQNIYIFMLTVVLSINAMAADKRSADDILSSQLASTQIIVSNQFGKKLDFYPDLIANKTVAINFIFTSCTSSCPLSALVFRQVQKKSDKKMHYISISVDPAYDTSERLLVYSQKINAGSNWSFITGDKENITKLLKAFGVYMVNRDEHSNTVIIGNDRQQKWTRLYGFPQPQEIETALKNVSAAAS